MNIDWKSLGYGAALAGLDAAYSLLTQPGFDIADTKTWAKAAGLAALGFILARLRPTKEAKP